MFVARNKKTSKAIVSFRRNFKTSATRNATMLSYALLFFVVALIAGAMGFGLVGGMAYTAAKICFFVFLVLAVISLVSGRRARV